MNKITKAGLLSLILIVQVITIIGGFIAYEQMSENYTRLLLSYLEALKLRDHPILTPNPFAPLVPLVLFGLLLTAVLLVDQIRYINAESRNVEAK